MIYISHQILAVDIHKELSKEETYAYASDIWVEGLGDIVAEVPATVVIPVEILAVYVKGACDVGGRIRAVEIIKGLIIARKGFAKIDEIVLYGSGDIVVKG